MDLETLNLAIGRALSASSLDEYLGIVSSVVLEIEEEIEGERGEQVQATVQGVFSIILSPQPAPMSIDIPRRRLGAEILSAVEHPLTLELLPKHLDALPAMLEPEALRQVCYGFAASLISIAFALRETFDMGAPHYLLQIFGKVFDNDSLMSRYVAECVETGEAPEQFGAKFMAIADDYLDAADGIDPDRITNAKPGDVLFRDLSLKGCRQFGHSAIYLGPGPDNDHADDLGTHCIVEMEPWMGRGLIPGILINRRQNCVISTVRDFKAHGGFWGAYAADVTPCQPLTRNERRQIVQKALSYVGRCRYGTVANTYKNHNARQFRCDGFVEHCYESIQPMAPRLKHREGLFEVDTFATLSPNSLRSCLFEKRAFGDDTDTP